MKIVILDKRVRRNLALFKHLIHKQAEKTGRYFQVAKKSYRAYLNCETGELRFADLQKKHLSEGVWKTIVIQLRPDIEGAFEVYAEGNLESFDCEALQAGAYEVFSKTLHILNQLSYDPKHAKNPFWILRHIAHLDFFVTHEDEMKRNLVQEAWHSVDREYAEYLLTDEPPGTYLFRKGEFAQILEDNLNENREEPVICITLTYRDWEEKISERTLVFTEDHWVVFADDMMLSGKNFGSVRELFESMATQLSKPLLTG
ncbi:MAG: hypothetical protein K1000chlam2_00125 [Chlamydiae bacterium]|nr:hypothetical protein [Chlamydiota bacterium]